MLLANAEPYLAISGPNILAVRLPAGYNGSALECDTPEARARVEHVLHDLLRRPVSFRIERTADEPGPTPASPPAPARRRDELEGDPMVRKVVELFEARPLHLEYEEDAPKP
jgi:DNA polymerase-3 subunit gamma/tau